MTRSQRSQTLPEAEQVMWSQMLFYIKRAAEGTRKAQGVVAQVLAKNSLDEIDVVSGATCSSSAL